jgi:hypothetical protein
MLLSGRPLLDTGADAALFVDPSGVLPRLLAATDGRFNVLLSGARGAGKSSLLRQLLLTRRQSSRGRTAVASTGTASSAAEVLTLVARTLGAEPPRQSADAAPAVADMLEALAAMDLGADAVVLVDNLPPALAHAVFGQLRDDLWQLPLAWVVVCADTDESAFLRPPADAFFDTVVRVPPLDADAMRDLLRRRATPQELDEGVLSSVIELAGGNPRAALDLARQLSVLDSSPARLHVHLAHRAQALAALGRPAAMLFAELQASGGASASDEALLARLGWTRARAAQVLDQLAGAGLIESTDVRNGPGRPRRVYRPVDALTR